MIASPKFLCDWRINQLCSADSSVGVNLNFDFVGVVIGVARISMMMSSGCGGHSSGGTKGGVGMGLFRCRCERNVVIQEVIVVFFTVIC